MPESSKVAEREFLRGKHAMFQKLPCPEVHEIAGHACVKIGDTIALHLAEGKGCEFTETPDLTNNGGQPAVLLDGTHGAEAVRELMKKLKSGDITNLDALL